MMFESMTRLGTVDQLIRMIPTLYERVCMNIEI